MALARYLPLLFAAWASACGPGQTRQPAPAGNPTRATASTTDGAPAPVTRPRLAALLEPIREQHHLPALGALVIINGKVAAVRVVGVRKLGGSARATVNDKFHLGSDTKAMTATLVAMLVEQGVVTWDATMANLFPTLAPSMDAGYRKATLAQLLGHQAGLPTKFAGPHQAAWLKLWLSKAPVTEQRQEFARALLTTPRAVPEGTFRYSNAGYMIAGAAIERLTGTSWEALLTERLFKPLGMSSCGFGAPASKDKEDQPWGHRGDQPVPRGPGDDNPAALGPAGTVHCALRDWAKFIQLHLDALRGQPRLLSAASFKRLHTPLPNSRYALGWGVRRTSSGTELTHDGSNTMWYARARLDAAKNRALLIVTNRADKTALTGLHVAAKAIKRAFP